MACTPSHRIKYYMPEWDDRYDLEYDFIQDKFSAKHNISVNNDVYAHEMLEKPPYDGILYSLGNLFDSINNMSDLEDITAMGHSNMRDYYRLDSMPNKIELFGDCGAFNYINLKRPPEKFTPENIAYLYNKLGFDYGVSVDHLVVESIIEIKDKQKVKRDLSLYEKRKRIKLSLENADSFIKICNNKKYSFVPVGSAQGYSPISYRNSVAALIELGYDYIALGGLVRRDTDSIMDIVRKVSPLLKGRRLHLLGVVRSQCLDEWKALGVTSVDSASYFRKAWLRSDQNYIAPDGKTWYAALRVPIVKESRMVLLNGHNRDITKLEAECIKVLREYDKGILDIETTLDILIKYDSLFQRNGNDGNNLKEKYRKTLQDKPWKACQCPICSQIGIEVMIFRRTNRNKRRGLHNTWVIYNQLKNH